LKGGDSNDQSITCLEKQLAETRWSWSIVCGNIVCIIVEIFYLLPARTAKGITELERKRLKSLFLSIKGINDKILV
jgi:hypothetical protein